MALVSHTLLSEERLLDMLFACGAVSTAWKMMKDAMDDVRRHADAQQPALLDKRHLDAIHKIFHDWDAKLIRRYIATRD